MLAFIIPVKHRSLCRSWSRFLALLERTLHSCCNQDCNDYKVYVVANEKIDISHPNIEYLLVDFPPYQRQAFKTRSHEHAEALKWDKGRKILMAMIKAKERSDIFHVMFVDSDDLVSNRLAGFVTENPEASGWYFDKGYIYSGNDIFLQLIENNFYKINGTSHIVRFDLCEVPSSINNADEKQVDYIKRFYGSHLYEKNIMSDRGFPLKELPFPGTICVSRTGENAWGGKYQRVVLEKI